jgi:hypothetical protein
MTNIQITEDVARRVLEVVDAGLVSGLGIQKPGQMCVEAAVCYALGLPHSDDPKCVSKAVRILKIELNDMEWSSNDARAKGMRRLAIAQLGTSTNFDDRVFKKKASSYTIKVIVPLALRTLLTFSSLSPHHASIKDAISRCEANGDAAAANTAAAAAYAAYAYAAAANTAYADAYAAYVDADAAAAYAADAAANTAAAAANTAYATAAVNAADAADAAAYAAYAVSKKQIKDRVLAQFAEGITQILIEMKTQGSEYLYLAPYEE